MAEIKVSQLPEATQINDNDLIMIVQSGTNKKITKANAKFASGDEIYVGDTLPSGEDADSIKFWLTDDDALEGEGNYITNEYSVATDKGYSCNYVNNANTYSTTEVNTGKKWIDGKDIYRKVIDFGTLPDYTSKSVAHNISNLDTIIHFDAIAKSNSAQLPIPYLQTNVDYGIYIYFDSANITITTGYQRSAYSSYIILEYTKSS